MTFFNTVKTLFKPDKTALTRGWMRLYTSRREAMNAPFTCSNLPEVVLANEPIILLYFPPSDVA